MKLYPGMIIKTNYSGPYRIISITRGCVCPLYRDEINGVDRSQPPHIHLELTRPNGAGRFYLNHFDEKTLKSVNKTFVGNKKVADYDWIEILDNDRPVQLTMF